MMAGDQADAGFLRGGAGAQATIAFLLRLRSRGIADIAVLRALEMVPRDAFVPHRYLDLALRDVALPIGCGQTMPEPFLVARAMEALSLSPGHRVLEIGTGSGYTAAVIARLATQVVSLERFQTLAHEASTRLAELGIHNVRVLRADGLALPEGLGLFDRVIIHGVVDAVPEAIRASVAEGGVIVCARPESSTGVGLVRFSDDGKGAFRERPIGPCRLTPLVPGLSLAL